LLDLRILLEDDVAVPALDEVLLADRSIPVAIQLRAGDLPNAILSLLSGCV